jgi:hypothetical protein
MARVGAAGDNAQIDSFHSLLQNNVLDSKKRNFKKSFESQSFSGLKEPTTVEGTSAV